MILPLLTPWLWNPILAQIVVLAAASGSDPTNILVGSGVAGAALVIFAAAAARGVIHFNSEVDHLKAEIVDLKAAVGQERTENAKERAEKDALRDQLLEQTIPTFARAAQAMVQQATPVIQQADLQQAQLAETFAHLLDRAEEVLGDG